MSTRSFKEHEPDVHPQAYVDPDATVIGNVILEEDSSVWPGTVLRGDLDEIRVGAASNVQDNAVCHADPGFPVSIHQECTIGHGAVVHGADIQSNSVIGMNATVLNGAKVGRGSIVAAGSVVTEDQEVPEGVLVAGTPAEVKTELDEDAGVLEASSHYVQIAGTYNDQS